MPEQPKEQVQGQQPKQFLPTQDDFYEIVGRLYTQLWVTSNNLSETYTQLKVTQQEKTKLEQVLNQIQTSKLQEKATAKGQAVRQVEAMPAMSKQSKDAENES